jgi:hypothetical protein
MKFIDLFSFKKELEIFNNVSDLFKNQKYGYFLYTYSESESLNLEREFSSIEELKLVVLLTEEPFLISVKDKNETYITLSGRDYFICHTKEDGAIKLYHFNENKRETDKLETSREKKIRVCS